MTIHVFEIHVFRVFGHQIITVRFSSFKARHSRVCLRALSVLSLLMYMCAYTVVQARRGSEVAAWEQETGETFAEDSKDGVYHHTAAQSPLDQMNRQGSDEEVRVLGLPLVDRGASEKFGRNLLAPVELDIVCHIVPILDVLVRNKQQLLHPGARRIPCSAC